MKLALGTAQFGLDYGIANNTGKVSFAEVEDILCFAKYVGIDVLDTATSYGNSEAVLGSAGINDYKVITKLSTINNNRSKVMDVFFKSLENLKKDNVYGLLIHDIDSISSKNFDVLFKEIINLKDQGLVGKVGFSSYTPEHVDFLLKNFDFDLIQVPFNILDHRLVIEGQLDRLKANKVEIYARSVFLQGLLLMSKKIASKKFKRWNNLWESWHEWLNDNQITALEATIRHAISTVGISKVIVGVNSKDQLEEIVSASKGSVPDIPKELITHDVDLLNPSNWSKL
jgi:aryl-alcohol dehydrogenase-like predicted oxidoreductase